MVWVNKSDHLVVKSLDKRGNVRRAASRLYSFLSALQTQLEFNVHPEYGYLSVNPGLAGTGLVASVTARLPNLAKNFRRLRRLCDSHDIRIRRQKHIIFELTSVRTHGVSEFQTVAAFFNGVREIVEFEKGLKWSRGNQRVIFNNQNNNPEMLRGCAIKLSCKKFL